jgi:hypothetical protein
LKRTVSVTQRYPDGATCSRCKIEFAVCIEVSGHEPQGLESDLNLFSLAKRTISIATENGDASKL